MIALGFYKNKLCYISYSFKPAINFDESIIYSKLRDLFGEAATWNNNKVAFDYEWSYIWQTNKTYMHYAKYSLTSNYKPNHSEIYMYSKMLKHQIDNDNF